MSKCNTNLVAKLAALPLLESACFSAVPTEHVASIKAVYSIKNYSGDAALKRRYQISIAAKDFQEDGSASFDKSAPAEIHDAVKFTSFSPTGNFTAIGREEKKDSSATLLLDVHHKGLLKCSINISNEAEGFYLDEQFSSFSWNVEETLFAFIVEKKQSKPTSYEKFGFTDDWGEGIVGKHSPAVMILNLTEYSTKILKIDKPVGQAVFGNGMLYAVAFENEPRQYGLIYCYNRLCSIIAYNLSDETYVTIPTAFGSVRSPTFDHATNQLLYLANDAGGPHHKAANLIKYNPENNAHHILVDTNALDTRFNGIYAGRLPSSSCINSSIILESVYRSTKRIFMCYYDGRVIDIVSGHEGYEYWKVADISLDGKDILAIASGPTKIPSLFIGRLGGNSAKWTKIDPFDHLSFPFDQLDCSVVKLSDFVEAVVVAPNKPSTLPLILLPHGNPQTTAYFEPRLIGGPNAAYTSEYSINVAALALTGYAVALVNYTGSIGFGTKSIEALTSNIGIRDLSDVMDVLEILLGTEKYDPENIFLCGGSHGGFIAAFLTGKHPDRFRACILRNPVIDLYSMHLISDIPDWAFGQAGLSFDLARPRPFTALELDFLYHRSPISVVEQVKTPTLVIIGALDRRVSPFHGKSWHSWLKARSVPTKLLVFPDVGHPLDTPDGELYGLEAILAFLKVHLKISR